MSVAPSPVIRTKRARHPLFLIGVTMGSVLTAFVLLNSVLYPHYYRAAIEEPRTEARQVMESYIATEKLPANWVVTRYGSNKRALEKGPAEEAYISFTHNAGGPFATPETHGIFAIVKRSGVWYFEDAWFQSPRRSCFFYECTVANPAYLPVHFKSIDEEAARLGKTRKDLNLIKPNQVARAQP